MKSRPLIAGLVAATAFVAWAPGAFAASRTFRSDTQSANGILTDCRLDLPDGTHCNAWVISATRGTSEGQRISDLSVTQYDVVISGGGFTPNFRGSGTASNARIKFEGKLQRAQASATVPMLVDCDEAACVETSLVISMSWTGTGPLASSDERYDDTFGACRVQTRARSSSRSATAEGTVNGRIFTAAQTVIPPRLSSFRGKTTLSGTCGDEVAATLRTTPSVPTLDGLL